MAKRLLLADDSLTIHRVVELTFADEDFEVISARSGTEAIEKINQVRPDIVIADVNMPEQDGYQVCKYVKSNSELANIPVILLKGIFEPYDEERAKEAGYDAVISKPFQSKSFIAKVKEVLASPGKEAVEPSPPPAEKVTPEAMGAGARQAQPIPPLMEAQPPKVEQPVQPLSTEGARGVEPTPRVEGAVPVSTPRTEEEIFSGIEELGEDEILELERQLEAQESMLEELSGGEGETAPPPGKVAAAPQPEVPEPGVPPKQEVIPPSPGREVQPPPPQREPPPQEWEVSPPMTEQAPPPRMMAQKGVPQQEKAVAPPGDRGVPQAQVPPGIEKVDKEGVVSLSDEVIEQIVERVVAGLSDKAIRDIAWEVIPELAERVIRQAIEEIKKG
jgi:CheY-like chemotaxis protein